MIAYLLLIVLILRLIQWQWKMRRVLKLSRTLRNKFVAFPIIGHCLMFLGTDEDRMRVFQNLGYEAFKNKYGMTSLWVGSEYYAIIGDAEVAGMVTKTRLSKTDEFSSLTRPLLGNGLIIAHCDIWRPRRKIMAPNFSPKNLNSFVDIFAKRSTGMISYLKPMAGSGTFSIFKYLTSYTMESVSETVLGVNIVDENPSRRSFVEAFQEFCKIMSTRFCQTWLQWDLLFQRLPMYTQFEKHRKTIHRFVDEIMVYQPNEGKINLVSTIDNEIIEKKRLSHEQAKSNEDIDNSSQNEVQIKTVLEQLMTLSGGINGYSNLELREEALVLLLAGTDTSAVGVAFCAMMLSRHQDVQEKAYNEILEVFGDSKMPINAKDLPKLKYIDAVVRESCRLFPPVPLITRKIDKDLHLPSGLTLVAGSNVVVNIWAINRNPRYWGSDSEEFNPDRFLNGPPEHPSAYMTFSYGPRNCLGYQYAMMSNKVAVATLLRHYRLLPPDTTEDLTKPLRIAFDIMLKHVDNFKLRLELRT